MKVLKPVVVCLALSAVVFGTEAKRAMRDAVTVTQPDGKTLKIKKVGDEFMHFLTTEDGLLLYKDSNGFYTYGRIDEVGAVVSTGIKATSGTYKEAVSIKDLDMQALAQKRGVEARRAASVNGSALMSTRAKSVPQSGIGLSSTTYPRTGSPKGLIILVQYSDVKFTLSDPATYFHEMINGTNFTQYGGTGSALEYFTEQSGGKFIPSFDVLGPVTLPNKRSYYGGNDRWGEDQNPHLMVTHAIDILDPTVNFAQYDTDGDGLIDNVYIFYAGTGEASYGSEDTVWPHSWDVREAGVTKRVDGVTVGHYACSNEWEYNKPDGIGTFVHEFSHVMGLPDLYNTVSNVYYTPGEYSVLDYGPYNNDGRTPPNYGAYERNAMGWVEPIMLDDAMSVTLKPISSGEFGLIPTSKNTEFFLLENRQLEGWDKYIPNHGMLIWHIDYNRSVFESNVVNNTRNHQYVDIVEANNNTDGSSLQTMKGWPFPGTTGKTSFTSTTSPALKDWSGSAIDLPITEIEEIGNLIAFNVAGGASKLDVPVGYIDATSPNNGYFIAAWNPVEGATDYLLSVYAEGEGENGEIKVGFDGKAVPTGWTASATGYYDTASNYGTSSPSFKFDKTNQTLTSPTLNGDVNSISLWIKGQSTDDQTYLAIDGLISGKWVNIKNIIPQKGKSDNVEITDIPGGVCQVRFTMFKSAGNIAVDDIVLTYGTSPVLLPHYNAISTQGQTSYRVDNLIKGVRKYFFTVQATDGVIMSNVSVPVHVSVDNATGVENIIYGGTNDLLPVEYFTLQGVRIQNPASGSVVIRRQGNIVQKVLIP